jgi:hypothetical protein
LKVAKDFKQKDTEENTEGRRVHEALFKRVTKGTPLPLPYRHMEPIAAKFAAASGEKHGEMRLALNENLQWVDYFAKDVWVRVVIDLLIVRGSHGIIVDWKTGKQKDDYDQLELSAACLACAMPELETFEIVYVWLKDKNVTKRQISRQGLSQVWNKYLPRVDTMKRAVKATNFPAKKSGLCGWCPVTTCPHYDENNK